MHCMKLTNNHFIWLLDFVSWFTVNLIFRNVLASAEFQYPPNTVTNNLLHMRRMILVTICMTIWRNIFNWQDQGRLKKIINSFYFGTPDYWPILNSGRNPRESTLDSIYWKMKFKIEIQTLNSNIQRKFKRNWITQRNMRM